MITNNSVGKEEIEKKVKELSKLSTAPDKETPDWMESDIRRGIIAGIELASQPLSPQSAEGVEETAEELWDKYSFHVDDTLMGLDMVANTSVIKRSDFIKAMTEYSSIQNKKLHDKLQESLNQNARDTVELKEKDEEIDRLKKLIKHRERSSHHAFYSNATTMTESQIENQFKQRWEKFKTENNL